MAYRISQKPAQRAAVLTSVFIIHGLLLILMLFLGNVRAPDPPPKTGSLTLVSLAAAVPASAPPPPATLPSKVVDDVQPLTDAVPSVETAANSTSAATGGCKTFESVSAALLADPAAVAAVIASPAETRSIADAIVLWNEGWSAAAPKAEGPLSIVRATVEASLRSVDRSCLDEEVAGPRLIPVPTGERTTFLVVGSGNWLWQELLLNNMLVEPARLQTMTSPAAPMQMR